MNDHKDWWSTELTCPACGGKVEVRMGRTKEKWFVACCVCTGCKVYSQNTKVHSNPEDASTEARAAWRSEYGNK